MRRLALVPILAATLLLPGQAWSVGVGAIEMQSALHQPLEAEIPLRGVDPGDIDDVIVTLAPEQAFRNIGLERPHFLTRLRFEIVERAGEHVIRVHTREPVGEPYLSFLIEIDAPTGNLLREYTVLIDPPVYATEEAEAEIARAEPDPEPVREQEPEIVPEPAPEAEPEVVAEADPEPAPEAAPRHRVFGDEPVFLRVERERDEYHAERRRIAIARAEEEARRVVEPVEEPERAVEPATHRTEAGDTAWDIASRHATGDTTVQQMMLALLRYNPEAFEDDNINRLRRGYVLRIPEQDEAQALTAQQAIARVGEQNALWQAWREEVHGIAAAPPDAPEEPREPVAGIDEDELRILGTDDGVEVAGVDDDATGIAEADLRAAREQLEAAELEKEELRSRVADLESTVEQMEQLITLRDEQLDQLQRQLEALEAEPAAEVAEVEPEPEVVEDAEAEVERDEEDDDAAAVAAAPTESEVVTERTQPGTDDGLVGRIVGTVTGVVGAAGGMLAGLSGVGGDLVAGGPTSPPFLALVAVVLLLGGLLVYKRRMAAGEDEDDELAAAGVGSIDEGDADEDYSDFFAEAAREEIHAGEVDDDDAAAVQALGTGGVTTADRMGDEESPADEESVDLGAMIDTGAGEKDDTIAEADVYLAYGLLEQAEDLLRNALSENPTRADYHEKLLEALYSAGNRDGFVEQAEQFQSAVPNPDEDTWKRVLAMGKELAPEHGLFAAAGDVGVAAPQVGERKPVSTDIELDADEGATDLDFGFDDDEDEAGGAPATADPGDFDRTMALDADDVLGGAGGDGGGPSTSTDTADEDSDLEFDLGEFDGLAASTDRDETPATMTEETVADEDDDGLEFDLGDFGGGGEQQEAETALSETGGDDDGGLDFDFDAGTTEDATGDGTDSPEVADSDLSEEVISGLASGAGDDQEIDLDLGADDAEDDDTFAFDMDDLEGADSDLEALAAEESDGAELADDDQLGSPVASGNGGEKGADDEEAEPVGDDDYDTMLDLARAYIDMGDADSAENALEEVIASGSSRQKQEAQSLLDSAR